MKVKVESGDYFGNSLIIQIPYELEDQLKLKIGDELEIDIPMVGGGAIIHKVEQQQRLGDEVL